MEKHKEKAQKKYNEMMDKGEFGRIIFKENSTEIQKPTKDGFWIYEFYNADEQDKEEFEADTRELQLLKEMLKFYENDFEFCKLSGLSFTMLNKYRTRERNPKFSTLCELAEKLRLQIDFKVSKKL